ncbi:Egl nine 1 [Elasticomyces elasticus]|nr:Egl nine 1 [Elasticomyces elasticus]
MVGDTQITPPVCGSCGKGGYLFKCGRCKTTHYCSKPCQTQGWAVHKTACKSLTLPKSPLPSNNVTSLDTTPRTTYYPSGLSPAEADMTSTVPQVCAMCGSSAKLSCSRCHHILYCSKGCQIKDRTMHESVCKFLGRPLGDLPQIVRYDQLPTAIDNDKAFFPAILISMDFDIPDPSRDTHRFSGTFLHGMKANSNFRVAYIMLDSDPQSPTFGELPPMAEVPVGGVLLARRDGRHVQTLQVVAVANFLRDVASQNAAFVQQEKGGKKKVGDGAVKRPTINPATFARAFKLMKEKAVADGDMKWAGVECPVPVEED